MSAAIISIRQARGKSADKKGCGKQEGRRKCGNLMKAEVKGTMPANWEKL